MHQTQSHHAEQEFTGSLSNPMDMTSFVAECGAEVPKAKSNKSSMSLANINERCDCVHLPRKGLITRVHNCIPAGHQQATAV